MEFIWDTNIILPKCRGKYRGIGLVEVIWKVIAIIIYQRLADSIGFHDILHGFRAWKVTVTVSLEAKIFQHITGLRKEVLYEIFLYLRNTYCTLDWGHALEILGW